jgi:hypothetical protein
MSHGRVQELESAEFDNGDKVRVPRCARMCEIGLVFQQHTLLAISKNLFHDIAGLVSFVANRY